MSLLRLAQGFDRLPDAILTMRANTIHQQLSTHADVFVSPSPTLPALQAAIDGFNKAKAKADEGGRVATLEKKNQRAALIDVLHLLSYYVLFVAHGKREVVLQAGYDLMKDPEAQLITKPSPPLLTAGEQQGWIDVYIAAVKGAKAYLHQYTTQPNPAEEHWVTVSRTSARHILKGLTPGARYYVRVGVVGAKAQVMFSDISSRIAS